MVCESMYLIRSLPMDEKPICRATIVNPAQVVPAIDRFRNSTLGEFLRQLEFKTD